MLTLQNRFVDAVGNLIWIHHFKECEVDVDRNRRSDLYKWEEKQGDYTFQLDQHGMYMLKYISSHKIGVSVEGPVHQFIMDEVFGSDGDHPDSQEGAQDHDAPVHGDQHSA